MLNYIKLPEITDPTRSRLLAYYEYGNRDNPDKIICLHGLSRNGQDFEFLGRELAKQYHVVCPDMAGRGKSDWLANKSDYVYSTYIKDIEALTSALSIAKADWIGTSMGGILGMMMAAGKPAFIKRLVLNDVGVLITAQGLRKINAYLGRGKRVFSGREEAMDYIKTTYAAFGINLDEHWQAFFDSSFIPLPDGGYSLAYDPDIGVPFRQMVGEGEIPDIDLSDFWNQVTCPTLILRGENSDILSHATALAMRHGRPNAKLVEFPGIGHAPSLFEPSQIATVAAWLDETASGIVSRTQSRLS